MCDSCARQWQCGSVGVLLVGWTEEETRYVELQFPNTKLQQCYLRAMFFGKASIFSHVVEVGNRFSVEAVVMRSVEC